MTTTSRNRKKSQTGAMPKGGSKAARLAAHLGRIEEARRGRIARVAASAIEDAGARRETAAEIEKLRAERDEYLNLARRERAEFDNYRKRVERDRQNAKRENLAEFLRSFFGPLDDLDRIVNESAKEHSYETMQAGVRLFEENLWKVLAKAGIKRINAQGKPFNPEFHEAVAMVPSADAPPNTVLEIFDNGYKLDDFVLKPARVVVSREPEQ